MSRRTAHVSSFEYALEGTILGFLISMDMKCVSYLKILFCFMLNCIPIVGSNSKVPLTLDKASVKNLCYVLQSKMFLYALNIFEVHKLPYAQLEIEI